MPLQTDGSNYRFEKYCNTDRWCSYWHQIKNILDCAPESVLEIGIGDNVVGSYLKNCTPILYRSIDHNGELKPDIVGDIDAIPLEDESMDVVCAFEVLEHIPFENFEQILKELRRVAKKYIIISLPHWGRHFSFEARVPFLGKLRLQKKINITAIRHKFDGQHYWEIGKKGYPVNKIIQQFSNAGLFVVKEYIAHESPYHHFFVLRKEPMSNI